MSKHSEKFHTLHQNKYPLFLFNVWDSGTAKIICQSGAEAVATSSWSVAEAQGYSDGQVMPFNELLFIVTNIVKSVDIPVTVDFESGYSEKINEICDNFAALVKAGISGINFEDQNIVGGGIFDAETQAQRISALRKKANELDVNIFINARTDVFLQQSNQAKHADLVGEVIRRGLVYREAGANGFFIPGTTDKNLIEKICSAVDLPVNIMDLSDKPDLDTYNKLGVKRVSIGPKSWIDFSTNFKGKVTEIYNK